MFSIALLAFAALASVSASSPACVDGLAHCSETYSRCIAAVLEAPENSHNERTCACVTDFQVCVHTELPNNDEVQCADEPIVQARKAQLKRECGELDNLLGAKCCTGSLGPCSADDDATVQQCRVAFAGGAGACDLLLDQAHCVQSHQCSSAKRDEAGRHLASKCAEAGGCCARLRERQEPDPALPYATVWDLPRCSPTWIAASDACTSAFEAGAERVKALDRRAQSNPTGNAQAIEALEKKVTEDTCILTADWAECMKKSADEPCREQQLLLASIEVTKDELEKATLKFDRPKRCIASGTNPNFRNMESGTLGSDAHTAALSIGVALVGVVASQI